MQVKITCTTNRKTNARIQSNILEYFITFNIHNTQTAV